MKKLLGREIRFMPPNFLEEGWKGHATFRRGSVKRHLPREIKKNKRGGGEDGGQGRGGGRHGFQKNGQLTEEGPRQWGGGKREGRPSRF